MFTIYIINYVKYESYVSKNFKCKSFSNVTNESNNHIIRCDFQKMCIYDVMHNNTNSNKQVLNIDKLLNELENINNTISRGYNYTNFAPLGGFYKYCQNNNDKICDSTWNRYNQIIQIYVHDSTLSKCQWGVNIMNIFKILDYIYVHTNIFISA